MGENSVLMLKTPSNFRSAKGAVTSAETRARTLVNCFRLGSWEYYWHRIPGLAQLHVRNSILVAKREVEIPKGVEFAAVETDIFTESLDNEVALIAREFGLARHLSDCRRTNERVWSKSCDLQMRR